MALINALEESELSGEDSLLGQYGETPVEIEIIDFCSSSESPLIVNKPVEHKSKLFITNFNKAS